MFEKITLAHKDLFSRFLSAQKIVLSDVSFTNCFYGSTQGSFKWR